MRVFLLLMFLIFIYQSWAKADDISGFEIEGISIGDSVIDYFTKKEINNSEKLFFPNSKKYYRIAFELQNSPSYDGIAFYILNNDENFIIHALEGLKYMNFNTCKIKQKEIADDLKDVFFDYKEESYEGIHGLDNESIYNSIDFNFMDGSASRIICTD